MPEDKGWHGIIDKVMRSEPVGPQILRSRENRSYVITFLLLETILKV